MSGPGSPKAVSDLLTVAKRPSTGKTNGAAVNVACRLAWVPIVAIVCFRRTPSKRTSSTISEGISAVGGRAGQVENGKQVCQGEGRVDGRHLLLAALRVVLGGAKVVAGLVSIRREPRPRWIRNGRRRRNTVAKRTSTGETNGVAVNVACRLVWIPKVAIVRLWTFPDERAPSTVSVGVTARGLAASGVRESQLRNQSLNCFRRVNGSHLLLSAPENVQAIVELSASFIAWGVHRGRDPERLHRRFSCRRDLVVASSTMETPPPAPVWELIDLGLQSHQLFGILGLPAGPPIVAGCTVRLVGRDGKDALHVADSQQAGKPAAQSHSDYSWPTAGRSGL
mmetsp:Transcript_16997/g.40046  ORF Transcript_16997/g.40046 Transcript_16997/m.40046 type:complete len:338 (+) Transcript_16997:165-1178(+)